GRRVEIAGRFRNGRAAWDRFLAFFDCLRAGAASAAPTTAAAAIAATRAFAALHLFDDQVRVIHGRFGFHALRFELEVDPPKAFLVHFDRPHHVDDAMVGDRQLLTFALGGLVTLVVDDRAHLRPFARAGHVDADVPFELHEAGDRPLFEAVFV